MRHRIFTCGPQSRNISSMPKGSSKLSTPLVSWRLLPLLCDYTWQPSCWWKELTGMHLFLGAFPVFQRILSFEQDLYFSFVFPTAVQLSPSAAHLHTYTSSRTFFSVAPQNSVSVPIVSWKQSQPWLRSVRMPVIIPSNKEKESHMFGFRFKWCKTTATNYKNS